MPRFIEKIHLFIPMMLLLSLWLLIPAPAAADPTAGELMTELGKTLTESLKAETAATKDYQGKLLRAENEKLYLTAAANGYQLQLSAFGNLLLSTGIDISALQKARSELRASMVEVQKLIDGISPVVQTLTAEQRNLIQQKALIEKQLSELRDISTPVPSIPGLEETAKQLSGILKEKEGLLGRLIRVYQERQANIKKIWDAYAVLSGQFDTAIEERKTKELFERRKHFLRFEGIRLLGDELGFLLGCLRSLALPGFWQTGLGKLWETTGFVLVSLVMVLAGAVAALARSRKTIEKLLSHPSLERLGKWHQMTRVILYQSLIVGGLTLLFYLYSHLEILYVPAPFLKAVAAILGVLLIARWFGLALGFHPPSPVISFEKIQWLQRFVRLTAWFSGAYVLLHSTLGQGAVLLIFLRLIYSVCLLVWAFTAWNNSNPPKHPEETASQPPLSTLGFRYLFLLMGGVPLILDMIGYGSLSFHWYLSWGRCTAVLFWWAIFLGLLREWDGYYREKSRSERNELLYDDYPVQWLMIRFGQFIWLISLIILLLLAWGNQETVLSTSYRFLSHPLKVGNMSFSLMGIFYAVLVLLITYAATRLWKWIFQSKFLSRSGMEVGLQDSITTITAYIIWMFGVLVALHVFGLNTASLAVAFGALGIGLGFGLQNIFNNFISGIILLFERPIQVGDDVEINGTWASVKKINVRSTVVQTYDNASLIIPNADFISNPVTNWSFKDKRLRRNIDVGVAYGSDVEKVRETLLEIAGNTPKVLKLPKPDVLFRDFGDSALIFRLRIWTDIDNMLKVETAIRFEIDRRFRERDIEIAFPQQDIHIRSVEGRQLSEGNDQPGTPVFPGKPDNS